MPATSHDIRHLVALIGGAREEAERLGPEARGIARQLAEAGTAADALVARGGPDEGIRPQDLTTGNDE